MAELVGVISGAVTIGALSVNVAMSVAKLKSYWDLLEDTPEDVRRLIEQLEILSLILNEIKDDQTQNPISNLLLDNASLSKCLENCKKAANRLRQLTDDMGNSIDTSRQFKKKWASAKVPLKKDKIEKFKLELESAIRFLSLSHDSYTRCVLRSFSGLCPFLSYRYGSFSKPDLLVR
jgi:Fungal N-terminal domain of STAND proteins